MAEKREGTVRTERTHTGLEENEVRPDEAGAHGAPQGEMRTDTASGMSGSKGVSDVGDPAVPTSRGGGLEVGRPSVYGIGEGSQDRTLEGQLRSKGVAGSGGGQSESETREEDIEKAKR